jgi:hypothetical protein
LTFDAATSLNNSRDPILGSGGPRQIQLGLRFVFDDGQSQVELLGPTLVGATFSCLPELRELAKFPVPACRALYVQEQG